MSTACPPATFPPFKCLPVLLAQFFEWLASDLPTGDGTPDALSEALKEEVWPNPLKFYFAEVPEGNFEGEGRVRDSAGAVGPSTRHGGRHPNHASPRVAATDSRAELHSQEEAVTRLRMIGAAQINSPQRTSSHRANTCCLPACLPRLLLSAAAEVEAEELQFEEEYDGAGLGLDEGEGEGVYEEGGEGEEGLGEEGLLDAGVEGGEGEEAFGEEGDGGEGSFGEGDY